MSWRSKKVWPQNRGRVLGKHRAASTQLVSMSFRRSDLIQVPGRISSKVVVQKPTSLKPTAAQVMENGLTRSS